jgi:hypothetical protein
MAALSSLSPGVLFQCENRPQTQPTHWIKSRPATNRLIEIPAA